MTKEAYGKDLERNIDSLLTRMRSMSYRPSPVREVHIPKGNGKTRPLDQQPGGQVSATHV